MNKTLIILWTSVLASVLLINCDNKEQPDTKDIFKDLDQNRTVYTGNDSLNLFPFEIFALVRFEGVSMGMDAYLEFQEIDSKKTFSFTSYLNQFEFEDYWDENSKLKGKRAILTLKTNDELLTREIIQGKTYKLIFNFHDDNLPARTNIPTELDCGYVIVDILPTDMKFMRQIPFGQ